jgi:Methyltransferase domain
VPLEQLGARAHPAPRPMTWGRLHDFALDCMRFGREQFGFDTLTIVDSDQLALRPGYSAWLAQCLAAKPNAGMLGNSPTRQLPSTATPPAKVAFAELDLWRPLLQRFEKGEQKFVHWSFWPATVYTAAAAADLVRFFDEDEQFKSILARSKIWATEEVILPTLTALLGHELVAHPCSYDFVKYRCPYTPQQMQHALDRADVFWAHPIQRRFDDVLRKQIRERHDGYGTKSPTSVGPRVGETSAPLQVTPPDPPLLLTRPILANMRRIEGWLEDDEADLLIGATVRALTDIPQARAIVEVGSYCGKATVVLAAVVKALCPQAKVYSIDPHDGRIGAADKIVVVPPSLPKLLRNLQAAGVEANVEVIQSNPAEVTWSRPIALLLIDGLHDHASVSSDFQHFQTALAPGGYVAFHDYATYFPGVMQLVGELIASRQYRCVQSVGTLALLQKIV